MKSIQDKIKSNVRYSRFALLIRASSPLSFDFRAVYAVDELTYDLIFLDGQPNCPPRLTFPACHSLFKLEKNSFVPLDKDLGF